MEFISLPNGEEDRFGTRHVRLWQAGVLDGAEQTRVHIARYERDSLLGRHPTKLWQLFIVIDGSGWVSGSDEVRFPISAGQWFFGIQEKSMNRGATSVSAFSSWLPLQTPAKLPTDPLRIIDFPGTAIRGVLTIGGVDE